MVDGDLHKSSPHRPGWDNAEALSSFPQTDLFKWIASGVPTSRVEVSHNDSRLLTLSYQFGQTLNLLVSDSPSFSTQGRHGVGEQNTIVLKFGENAGKLCIAVEGLNVDWLLLKE